MKSEVFNTDCLDAMKSYPDNYFELAIVDPPYGIGADKTIHIVKPDRPSTWNKIEKYKIKNWDSAIPNKNYFDELFRVSKNQIIWGGNYFTEYLKPSKCWVFWDKQFDKTFNFSHGELAWTSFDSQLKMFKKSSKSETRGGKNRIHPTQKPVALYRWLLKNYAKPNDKILDTHLGSGSSRIAADMEGYNFTGYELDKDYFDASVKRFNEYKQQIKLL
jgi:site-specific DNA-methyltransferase (adenine-specific)